MAQTTLGIDVLGVVRPEAVQAVAATTQRARRAAGHAGDGRQRRVRAAVAQADPFVELTAVACPDLTAIIEGGFPFDERVVEIVRDYAAPLRAAGVDTVILGCTHYPLVAPMLQRMLGPRSSRSSPPARRSRARSSTCSARAGSRAPPSARATTASCAPGTSRRSASSGRASCRCRSASVEHVDAARARRRRREPRAQPRPRRPTRCDRSTIEPGLRAHGDRVGAHRAPARRA